MKKTKILLAIMIPASIFATACWKELDSSDCDSADCVKIKLAGQVYTQDSMAVPNAKISAWWLERGAWSATYKVASGVSENDGSFNIGTTIDTSFFIDYYLYVNAFIDDTSYMYNWGNHEKYFEHFDKIEFQNIKFTLYHLK
jgi:hypothetical protein